MLLVSSQFKSSFSIFRVSLRFFVMQESSLSKQLLWLAVVFIVFHL